MALLEILHYPDKRLRTVASPVTQVDDSIRKLIDDMFETMYAAPGIGLAATQVDVHKRLIVMDISAEENEPRCFINPEIIVSDGVEVCEEGCLSVPDIYESVERAEHVVVSALDRDGNNFTLEADGLLAVCIQHEMDHLVGKLFVDYLSPLKFQRIKKKLQKNRRQAAII
jgi:peptide deformylase